MRFQLALNVENLDESIAYYSKLFGVEVNKRKPGYANFAVDNPPLKLVLFEQPDARIEPLGLADKIIMDETCCYAEKSTVYAHDPEGLMWEYYKFRGDSVTFGNATPETPAPELAAGEGNSGSCCGPSGNN